MFILMLNDGKNAAKGNGEIWRNALGGQLMRGIRRSERELVSDSVMMDMAETQLQSARLARQSARSILEKQPVRCPNKRIENERERPRFCLFASQNAEVRQVASFPSFVGC